MNRPFRWTRYSGSRIITSGWRTVVELPATQPFGPTARRYGCVWKDGESFKGYFEIDRPGEIEDVELGPFNTEAEARRAVECSLAIHYNRFHKDKHDRGTKNLN